LRHKIKSAYIFFVKIYELVHDNDVHQESQIGENDVARIAQERNSFTDTDRMPIQEKILKFAENQNEY